MACNMEQRDLSPEESVEYSDISRVLTDPALRIVFADPRSNLWVFKKGFYDRFVRSWKLIEKGMLMEVECRPLVPYNFMVEHELDVSDMSEEEFEDAMKPVPDLCYRYSHERLPDFTPPELTHYVRGFTEKSIHYLKLGDEMTAFVRKNQEGVISYLAKKLNEGNLRFYRVRGSCVELHGPIAVEDFTDPEKPKLLYLVYGLRPLLWGPPRPKINDLEMKMPYEPSRVKL